MIRHEAKNAFHKKGGTLLLECEQRSSIDEMPFRSITLEERLSYPQGIS